MADGRGMGRKTLLAKTSSKCAYCGRPLTVRTMQRDHVQPIVRYRNARWTFSGRNGCKHPENHRADNIVVACAECNRSKGAFDLTTWRASLRWPGWRDGIVFYFERHKKEAP